MPSRTVLASLLVQLTILVLLSVSCMRHPVPEYIRNLNAWSRIPVDPNNYRWDCSLVEDTVLPYQQIWIRYSATNLTDDSLPTPDLGISSGLQKVCAVTTCLKSAPDTTKIHTLFPSSSYGWLAPGEVATSYNSYGELIWDSTCEVSANPLAECFISFNVVVEGGYSVYRRPLPHVLDTTLILYVGMAFGEELRAQEDFVSAQSLRQRSGFDSVARRYEKWLMDHPISVLSERVIGQLTSYYVDSPRDCHADSCRTFPMLVHALQSRDPKSPYLIRYGLILYKRDLILELARLMAKLKATNGAADYANCIDRQIRYERMLEENRRKYLKWRNSQ